MDENSTQNNVNDNFFVRKRKMGFILGGVVILLVVLISFFVFSKKTQNVSQKVSPNAKDTLLVTVGDQKIYKSDVQKAAREQYVSSAIDNSVLQVFLDLLIEQKILDLEAAKLGITVSQAEIDSSIYSKTASGSAKNTNLSKFARYSVLKDKIMAKQVKSVSAYTIGFWIPPLSYPQKAEYVQKREDGRKALIEAEGKLKAGEKPLDTVKYMYSKYPILGEILSFNGYLMFRRTDESVFEKPAIYTFNQKDLEKLNDPEFYNALQMMKEGEIRRIEKSDQSGGDLIQVVSVNGSGFSNYDDFLATRKKELVKMESNL